MKRLIPLILFLLSSVALYATHNRAGEIVYSYVSGTTYQITVNIFSDPTSPAFQRKEIVIDWGDNTGRDSISQTIVFPKLTDNIQKRSWIVRHTFPGPGDYTISVTDPNRSGDVDNISNPSGVPFYLESRLRISPLGSLRNNSPILLNDPIDNACAGQIFIHNPGAVDPDGDSLAYEIAPSYGDGGIQAPGYTYPPSSNPIYVDPQSGDLVMDVPFAIGLFNVGIRIKEYRNNILVGSILRDLQIQVFPGCNNNAPVINANSQYCIEAGRQLSFTVNASDPDPSDDVRMSATGEPLILASNPASFNQTVVGNPSSATFIWRTNCNNARQKLYDLSIKAEDNATDHRNASTNLTTFKSVVIRVIAPGPENAIAQKAGTGIQLNWDNLACPNAAGFKIYRRIDSSGYQSSNCIPGVPEGIGYSLIATIEGVNNTAYFDDNNGEGLVPERKYCYLITKYFADGDESYVSNEVCAEIEKIIPLMTKVSVSQTDVSNGQIQLQWSAPDTIDQSLFPPPYRYLIQQRSNETDGILIIDSTDFNTLNYTVNQLNTQDFQYEYRVALISLGNSRRIIGYSPRASSIFLNLSPSDNRIRISWDEDVPWINTLYTIFRKGPSSPQYDSLTTIDSSYYIDFNLANGRDYCYYVKSIGSYEINSIDSPLVNLSQTNCARPIDDISPCPPAFDLNGDCSFGELTLNWYEPQNPCDSDVVGFRIYRSSTLESPFELLEEINDPNENSYTRSGSIAGCYYVAAVDSANNESAFSKKECVDYCPIYELPNIFTPNGDGINDIYVPKPNYKYVDSVQFQLYNRWDQMIFETNEPDLNWNGLNSESKELVSDGIYFYICQVFERTLDGSRLRILKGTITVVDSKEAQNFK